MRLRSALLLNALLSLSLASVVAHLTVPEGSTILGLFFTVQRAVWLGSIASVSVLMLVWIRGVAVSLPGDAAAADLHRSLVSAGYHCSLTRGVITVRLGKYTAVRLRVLRTADRTWVYYTPYATPGGMVAGVLLVVFVYTAAVAVIGLLNMLRVARHFVEDVVPSVTAQDETVADGSGHVSRDIDEMLSNGLYEARRVAFEAFESARSKYDDYVIGAAASSLGVAGVIFMAVLFSDVIGDVSPVGLLLLLAGVCLPLFVVLFVIVRIRVRPKVEEIDAWVRRLDLHIAAERSDGSHPDDFESLFEVLGQAGRELPNWIRTRQRARSFRHPVAYMSLFFVVYISGMTLFSFVLAILDGKYDLAALFGGVSAGLICIGVLLISYVRKVDRAEKEEFCSRWKGQYQSVKEKMDKMLQEL